MKKNNKVDRKRKLLLFNKYTWLFIGIYFLLSVGVTYAYLAFQVEENSVITGNVVAIDAEVDVELVVGSYEEMVPLDGEALSNALNGVGSTNGACVDSAGNLSCQVYKITLTNKGSRLRHIDGTIELYAKDGEGNVYNNLMWREITNPTTIKEDAIFHTMPKSKLVSDITLASKEVRVWYIAVWINEIEEDQLETDKGDFEGVVTFESFEVQDNVFVEEIMEPNVQSDSGIDFSKTSKETNTNGIYLRSGTENDTYPIYYYRGNVNNNLIFANTCWKVVRTTETGGLKLIYNGVPSNGQCNNTGESSQIGTKAFNSTYTSPAYVGYMYGTPYNRSTKSMSSDTTAYVYGNSVSYSNWTYTLTDTITSADWSSIYNGGLNNNHYTCFTTGTTCNSVYYIYFTNASTAYYITLTNGKKVEDALDEMLGADDSKVVNYNTISSTIKGDKDTAGTLYYWYYNNIELAGYSDYIEDTVWCNDRNIGTLNGWDPNGGNTTAYLYFAAYNRAYSTYEPSLICDREIDSFTVSEENGNGDLDYPVGLLTADEIMLAGGRAGTGNSTYYLYSGSNYWAGSPNYFSSNNANEFNVNSSGYLYNYNVSNTLGVRPSLSLKRGFKLTGDGDGSVSNPYVLNY